MTPAVSTTSRPSSPPQIFSTPASASIYADFVSQPTNSAFEFDAQHVKVVSNSKPSLSTPDNAVAYYLDSLFIRHDEYKAAVVGPEFPYKRSYAPLLPTLVVQKKGRGRPSTVMVNSLKPYLTFYNKPRDALDDMPILDDIVTGVVQLDLVGNTRSLNKVMMIEMLQDLNFISADFVESWMGCGKRHAQKVASCLRLIVTLSLRVTHLWPEPFEGERWVN